MWLFREVCAPYIMAHAVCNPAIRWRNLEYRLKWGGVAVAANIKPIPPPPLLGDSEERLISGGRDKGSCNNNKSSSGLVVKNNSLLDNKFLSLNSKLSGKLFKSDKKLKHRSGEPPNAATAKMPATATDDELSTLSGGITSRDILHLSGKSMAGSCGLANATTLGVASLGAGYYGGGGSGGANSNGGEKSSLLQD